MLLTLSQNSIRNRFRRYDHGYIDYTRKHAYSHNISYIFFISRMYYRNRNLKKNIAHSKSNFFTSKNSIIIQPKTTKLYNSLVI